MKYQEEIDRVWSIRLLALVGALLAAMFCKAAKGIEPADIMAALAVADSLAPASSPLSVANPPEGIGAAQGFSNGPPAARRVLTEADLSADQQPTPMAGVAAVLDALNPQRFEVLVDYGCGFDARYLITACRVYGTLKAIGVEIDPEIADSARAYVEAAGLSDRIEIITGDALRVDVKADIGVAYLWPETLTGLRPKIQQLQRFASYAHDVPGLVTQQTIPLDGSPRIYLWEKPTARLVPVTRQATAAYWNGRTYSHALCSRPNCAMCNAIRAQLTTKQIIGYQTVAGTPQPAPVTTRTTSLASPSRVVQASAPKVCKNCQRSTGLLGGLFRGRR